MMTQRRVGVLMGGWGEEREISMKTGEAIAGALERLGHWVERIVAGHGLDQSLRAASIDVAFLALHGRMGEDGKVQGLLEVMGIPYTGSGVLASALAMNKGVAKKLFRQHNLATPHGYVVSPAELARLDELQVDLGFPCVVKPAQGGSSIGVSLVGDASELVSAVAQVCRTGGDAVVERYVKGREVTVGLLGGEILGSLEVRRASALPPLLSPTRVANLEAMALAAYRALGCRGPARVDFICPDVGNEVLLGVNTLPGMTATSLFPMIGRRRGLSFDALCERILSLAWSDAVEVGARVEVSPRAMAE